MSSTQEGRRIMPAIAIEDWQIGRRSNLMNANRWLGSGEKEPASISSALFANRRRMNV